MGSQSTREFTKVVIRQLPPTMEEVECKAAFDKEFANRYNWFNFARGKIGCVTPASCRCSLTGGPTLFTLNVRCVSRQPWAETISSTAMLQ